MAWVWCYAYRPVYLSEEGNMNKKTLLIAAALTLAGSLISTRDAKAQTGPYSYYALTPCRVIDTRTTDAPAIPAATSRDFDVTGKCGIPTGAKAVTLNVTVVSPTCGAFLTLYPSGITRPQVATINFATGDTVGNGAIVPVSTNTNDLSIYNQCGTTNVVVDVTGYFQ